MTQTNGKVPDEVINFIANATSALSSRHDIAQRAGYAYGTDRDYYKILGYSRTLSFVNYLAKYEREDIAGRIIDAPAEDTWREMPTILDGDNDDTAFVTEVQALFDRVGALEALENVDALTGIGHYGVLFLGMTGEEELHTPVLPGAELMYLRGYDEGLAKITRWDNNSMSERFGLPDEYEIDFGQDSSRNKKRVHWSRIIHVAERRRRSLTHGEPRLRGVYNRLDDLMKVVGGSSEAYWKLVYKGMIVSSKDGYRLPTNTDDLDDQLVDFMNDLRRHLILDGMDVNDLGGQDVDPSALVDVLISLISSKTRIPKRMLLGAELSKIASTQDAANWAGYIRSRRMKFAEPVLLRPLLDRLIMWQTIPAPTDKYAVTWKPLFELNELERAEVAERNATALERMSGGVPHLLISDKEAREMIGLPGLRTDDSSLIIDLINDVFDNQSSDGNRSDTDDVAPN